MRERRKDSWRHYGFLLDRDVSKAAEFFPSKRTRTMVQVGLPENAPDRRIVEKAWERELILVTSNGDDFVKEIERYLSQTKTNDCRDMNGLVVLPNGYEHEKRLLPGIAGKLRFSNRKITWADVHKNNYLVRVKKNGKPEVIRKFPPCFYCQKLQAIRVS